MKTPKQDIITRRLIINISILALMFVIINLFGYYGISSISRLTRTIYDHPLVGRCQRVGRSGLASGGTRAACGALFGRIIGRRYGS